jgi:hypothetical protein
MHKCKILSFKMYGLKYIWKYKIQINFCDKLYVAAGYVYRSARGWIRKDVKGRGLFQGTASIYAWSYLENYEKYSTRNSKPRTDHRTNPSES